MDELVKLVLYYTKTVKEKIVLVSPRDLDIFDHSISFTKGSYPMIWINRNTNSIHRLIGARMFGDLKDFEIDHINGNKCDN